MQAFVKNKINIFQLQICTLIGAKVNVIVYYYIYLLCLERENNYNY